MATPNEVLDVIAELNIAYGKELSRAQTEMYISYLGDVPVGVLKDAAEYCIKHNDWYPKISELRKEVERRAGTENTRSMIDVNQLAAQQLEMEQHFFNTGELDEEAWANVTEQFERLGRTHRAEFMREKLRRLQQIG